MLSFTATVLSMTGYFLVTDNHTLRGRVRLGLWMRLVSGVLFTASGLQTGEHSMLGLIWFFFALDTRSLVKQSRLR